MMILQASTEARNTYYLLYMHKHIHIHVERERRENQSDTQNRKFNVNFKGFANVIKMGKMRARKFTVVSFDKREEEKKAIFFAS